ncbi:serine hydrolase domain-containing protein [Kribbella deserti]|uniref:Serine hydrolase domain-containing protein n=1 Tax=Kribbella deserti TaxID=1926257 RepID=A0ABV6QU90_9ACTN
MRRGVYLVVALALLLSSGANVPAAQATPHDRSALSPEAISRVVEQSIGPTRLPGVAVVVVGSGRVLHSGGYGQDSRGTPITGNTLFRIASVSKAFTALAVQQLAVSGRLRLDDPVAARLPEFAPADSRARRITIRQLLNHTSGLSDRTFPEATLPQPDSLREAVAALRTAELATDPGARHDYHNPNYWVAARLVEVVSGQSFEQYLRQRILGPLGMRSTVALTNWKEPVPGLAEGYNRFLGFTVARPEPDRFVAGSAGLVSSADDLARWLLLNSGSGPASVLSGAGLDELHRPSAPADGRYRGRYALGWDVPEIPDGPRQVSHSGSSFTGTAQVALLPGSGHAIAVLANSRMPLESDLEAIMTGLIALTQGRAAPPAGPPAAFIADLVMIGLGFLMGLLGTLTIRRSRGWARRRHGAPLWLTIFRLLMYLSPLAALLALPRLLEILTAGRSVTFQLVSHIWPTLLVTIALAAVLGLLIITTRALALRDAE